MKFKFLASSSQNDISKITMTHVHELSDFRTMGNAFDFDWSLSFFIYLEILKEKVVI